MRKGPETFDKYMLWALNHVAVANIIHFGGRYREDPIYVGNHRPPHYKEVSHLMDRLIAFVHENWSLHDKHPTLIPAYALWRLNWIHPFVEGNGRTARAACYYLICLQANRILPGRKIVPERIRENRAPYYKALQASDKAWENGGFNVTGLADYLQDLLFDQLKS